MQQVKMAECYFHGDWEENIPEQLRKLLKPAEEPPSWHHSRPKQYNSASADEYKEIVQTEEFKSLKYYHAQHLTMSWNDYMELTFIDNIRHQLRSDRTFNITVDQPVADVFGLIEAHVALMDKTFKQLLSTQLKCLMRKLEFQIMTQLCSRSISSCCLKTVARIIYKRP